MDLNKVPVISNNTVTDTTLHCKVYDEYNTVQYNWSDKQYSKQIAQ